MKAICIVGTAFIITLAIMAMLLVATAGNAQTPNCAPSDTLSATMATKYGEVPIWLGVCGPAQCVIFANAETQTWSFVRVEGPTACMVLYGTGYAAGPDLAPPPPVGEEG